MLSSHLTNLIYGEAMKQIICLCHPLALIIGTWSGLKTTCLT